MNKTAQKRANAERNIEWIGRAAPNAEILEIKNDGWHAVVRGRDGMIWDFWPSTFRFRSQTPKAAIQQGPNAFQKALNAAPVLPKSIRGSRVEPDLASARQLSDSAVAEALRRIRSHALYCLDLGEDCEFCEGTIKIINQELGPIIDPRTPDLIARMAQSNTRKP